MKAKEFDRQLKNAVHEVCLAMAARDASAECPCEPSDDFKTRLKTMFRAHDRRIKHNRKVLCVAACIAALLIGYAQLRSVISLVTWHPEGYTVAENSSAGRESGTITFYNPETEDQIVVSYGGAEDKRIPVEGFDSSKVISINGRTATVYWNRDGEEGTVLIMSNETGTRYITVSSDASDPDFVISVAENITRAEQFSRNLP